MNFTNDKGIKFIQRPLEEIIRVIFVQHPIDIGKFTVKVISEDREALKRDLDIDFDDIKVYPGPQPRDSGDIELYKNEKIIRKINAKTAVSGDITATFKKLWSELTYDKDGLLVSIFVCNDKKTGDYKTILIFIYLPNEITQYPQEEAMYILKMKIYEKAERENCENFSPLAINDAIQFEYLRRVLITEEKVDLSIEKASEASEKSQLAFEKASEASEKSQLAFEKASEASEKSQLAFEKASEASEIAAETIEEIKEVKKILKEMYDILKK